MLLLPKASTCDSCWPIAPKGRKCLEGYVSSPRWLRPMTSRCSCRKAPALFKLGPLRVINPPEFSSRTRSKLSSIEKALLAFFTFSVLLSLFLTSSFSGSPSLIKHMHINCCLSVHFQGSQPKAVSDLEYFRNRHGRP